MTDQDNDYAYLLMKYGPVINHYLNTIQEMDRYTKTTREPMGCEGENEEAFIAAYNYAKRYNIVDQDLTYVTEKVRGEELFSVLVWHKLFGAA